MAGKLGTVYVELSLDDKVYKERLSQIKPQAEATAKGLETSWKALGVKTNEYFDNSRKAAENAYALILKSGKYGADERLRAEKAMHDQITRLNEQQFGHQTSLISGLKSHWLAASAVIASAGVVAMKGWSMAKAGAEFEEQRGILDNLGAKYGMTADGIVADMERASDGLVSRADLMSVALGGIAKGLNPEQLTNLADAARILGDAAGKDATTALRELTEALETGRTKGLKTYLGTALDLETTFGDLVSKMTAAEKTQAMYNATMIAAADIQGKQVKAVSDTADQFERLEARYQNIMTLASRFSMKAAVSFLKPFEFFDEASKGNIDWRTGKIKPTPTGGADIDAEDAYIGVSMRGIAAAQSNAALKKTIAGRQSGKAGKREADERMRNEQLYIKQTAEAQAELEKARAEFGESENKRLGEEEKKRYDAIQLGIKQDAEAEAEWNKARVEFAEWEKGESKVTIERLTAQRSMYEDMRGFEQDYYTTTTLLIDQQAEAYRKLGLSEAAIEKWAQGEKLKAFDAYVDKAGTLYQRLEKRTRKYAEDAGDMHKALFESIDAGAKDLERQMSDNFFDVLTGNMQQVSLDWDSMWQAMARSASNYVAKIASDMAVSYGSKAVASGASWLWDLAGGASGISDVASSGWDSLVDFFTGFAEGSIEISEDKLARLHKGEMVIPADQAESLRAMFSGQSPSDAGFPDFAGFSLSPEMGYAVNQAAIGFMGGYGKAMLGKEIAALALTGTLANPVLGLMATARELMGAAFTGYAAYQEMASFRDIAELATEYGGNIMGGYGGIPSGIGMDMGGYEGGYGGGTHGDPTGDMGGPGGDPGDGWRLGGISAGPSSGHWEKLHGEEAVIPLPNGRSVPVEMKNGGGDLPPVQLILQLDARTVAEALFKLSRAGVKIIHQNGITAI